MTQSQLRGMCLQISMHDLKRDGVYRPSKSIPVIAVCSEDEMFYGTRCLCFFRSMGTSVKSNCSGYFPNLGKVLSGKVFQEVLFFFCSFACRGIVLKEALLSKAAVFLSALPFSNCLEKAWNWLVFSTHNGTLNCLCSEQTYKCPLQII